MSRSKKMQLLSTFLCICMLLYTTYLPSIATQPQLLQAVTNTSTTMDTFPFAAPADSLALSCKSAILMEASSGAILYEQNANEALPPASVTKIMTLLLVMEAIDAGILSLTDSITVSATAASMGGSQVFLEEGESMSCEDMLKSVIISSANDAAVALAEHIAGDINTFVQRMNQRAQELGMQHTHFENATGLDDTAQNHLTSAKDIAIMSRALIAHEKILSYSSIWMDSIRNGTFGLTNTNRLVRFYKGATGLKTGSTEKAGFCVSATAQRDGLSLICVIMGAETRDIRNAQASKLLDWGFANYTLYTAPIPKETSIKIIGGEQDYCPTQICPFSCVIPKGRQHEVTIQTEIPNEMAAPLQAGQEIGYQTFRLGDLVIGQTPIIAAQEIPRISYFTLWKRLFRCITLKSTTN